MGVVKGGQSGANKAVCALMFELLRPPLEAVVRVERMCRARTAGRAGEMLKGVSVPWRWAELAAVLQPGSAVDPNNKEAPELLIVCGRAGTNDRLYTHTTNGSVVFCEN